MKACGFSSAMSVSPIYSWKHYIQYDMVYCEAERSAVDMDSIIAREGREAKN